MIVTTIVILGLVTMMMMSLIMVMVLVVIMDLNHVYLLIHINQEPYLPTVCQKSIFMSYFTMMTSKTIGNTLTSSC